MNPKISDFGLSRSLGADQSHVLTTIAGTNGYRCPESMIGGVFSTTSDLYTFGVAVLEIVSGKGCINFFRDQEHVHIVGFARRLQDDGKIMDLVDDSIQVDVEEARRCIQVGILCTGEARQRPTMSEVLDMLGRK